MLEANLAAGDVRFGLLDKCQMIGHLRQTQIRRHPRLLDRRRTSGNQHCVELVVLGPAQMKAGKGLDLNGLQHEHDQACLAQMPDHAPFVAAGRLDAGPRDPGLEQLGDKTSPAERSVLNRKALAMPRDGHVKLGLGRIDSCRQCVNLVHLRRPCLVKRTSKVPATIRVR